MSMPNETASVLSMTVVTSAYGDGQRMTAVAIEYSDPVVRGDLEPEMFDVEGFTITNLCVSDTARGELVWTGHFVQLLLEGEPQAMRLCERGGRGEQLTVRHPVLRVTQKQAVTTASGRVAPAFAGKPTTAVDLGIAAKFTAAAFTMRAGEQLHYNLYIPEHMVPGQQYPVVLFMHDLGACSQDVTAPLLQGSGATVWAIES